MNDFLVYYDNTHYAPIGAPKGQRGGGGSIAVGRGVEVSSGLNRALTGGRGRRGAKGGSVQPTDKILQVIKKI